MKIKVVIVSLLIVTGLKDITLANDHPDIDSVNNFMRGKWIWKYCNGGFAGWCSDNPGPGNQRSVIFSGTDTDSVLFEVYRNDTLILSDITIFKYMNTDFNGHWIIEQDVVRGGIEPGPSDYYIIHKTDSITIEFIEPCIDCFYYGYEKEKITTDITVLNNEDNLIVYPNPVDGKLFISSKNIITGLEIIDLTGKAVLTKNYISVSRIVTVDVSHINRGIYFIKTFSNSKTYTGRLLKL